MDDELRRIVSIRVKGTFERRQEQLRAAIAEVTSKSTKHGILQSTVNFQRTEELCVREMRDRVEDAWKIFQNVLEKLGTEPSPALADEIKSEIRNMVFESQTELNMLLWGTPGRETVPIAQLRNMASITEEALKQVGAEVDLFFAAASRRDGRSRTDSKAVFLTHASADAEIAMALKAETESRIPGASVFCSSNPTDLPLGAKWSIEIQKALQQASMLIMLCTAHSLRRPWVWFECGTFWFDDRKKIPVCLGEVQKGALPAPLSELQAGNGYDPEELKGLFATIAQETGLSLQNSLRFEYLAASLQALALRVDRASAETAGWLGADWNEKYLAYDGPYEGLRLIEAETFEPSMQAALQAAGFHVVFLGESQLASQRAAGFRLVQLTDRKSWRRRIAVGDVALAARPQPVKPA